MNYKTTTVSFGSIRKINGPPIQWQYNEKQYLIIRGLNLPEFYAVDFCNLGDTSTITMSATENGVEIPDQFLVTGKPLVAYIVVVDGESVNTIGQITFPVTVRGRRTDISPEPAEQQQIDALIDTMNQAVSDSEASAQESERQAGLSEDHAEDSEAWAVGERAGEPVEDTDETYQNNAKWYAGQADSISRGNAIMSESWAIGGTGTRQGEDNDNAKHYAEVAQQGAEESGYVWFDVDDQDGEMYVTITPNLEEDVSFLVNESIGTLEVTVNG